MIFYKPQSLLYLVILFTVDCVFLAGQTKAQTPKKDLWTVTATDTNNYTPAYLGNGMIGLRSQINGLGASRVIINGLYDRGVTGENIRLINNFNPTDIRIFFKNDKELLPGSDVKNWKQVLNLKEATLQTTYTYANILKVKTQLVSLRNLPMASMGIYDFEAADDVTFNVQNSITIPDYGKTNGVYKSSLNYNTYNLSASSKEKIPVISAAFPTESGTDCVSGANTFYFDGRTPPQLTYTKLNNNTAQVVFTISLKKGERYSFCMLSAFTHSGLTADPYNDAIRICARDYNLGYRHLLTEHKTAWDKLWQSDIQIEGDDEVQVDARLALYSLYCSIAKGFDYSIPPCGLAETGWGGHIFWDAELWMYPPLLVLQPDFAASVIDFRSKTLPQAKKRAAQFGYQGAMFPWESDLQGSECTSISYKLDMNEHHVTADVALATWNYYLVTKNEAWLQQKGFPLIKDIADFWVSRTTKDSQGNYHINNVVGPDEYFEDVDDDAFTNGAVKVVLDAAIKGAKIVNQPINPEWINVRDKIVILQHKNGYTLQNAQYTGQVIKQADVNLLAYPLGLITNKTQIVNDLNYYEPKINPRGPSMSYSVLAASYARLGQAEKAYALFQKAYQPNRKPPFNFIAEKPVPSSTVFCTGYGGILQTIIFGFAGMKIGENGLYQDKATLPNHWKKLTIKISGKEDVVCTANHN